VHSATSEWRRGTHPLLSHETSLSALLIPLENVVKLQNISMKKKKKTCLSVAYNSRSSSRALHNPATELRACIRTTINRLSQVKSEVLCSYGGVGHLGSSPVIITRSTDAVRLLHWMDWQHVGRWQLRGSQHRVPRSRTHCRCVCVCACGCEFDLRMVCVWCSCRHCCGSKCVKGKSCSAILPCSVIDHTCTHLAAIASAAPLPK
jgi:hypothetical protein